MIIELLKKGPVVDIVHTSYSLMHAYIITVFILYIHNALE